MIVTPDVKELAQRVAAAGFKVSPVRKMDPSPLKSGKSIELAITNDPDGFQLELLQINR